MFLSLYKDNGGKLYPMVAIISSSGEAGWNPGCAIFLWWRHTARSIYINGVIAIFLF
jgi:hypothetical protein